MAYVDNPDWDMIKYKWFMYKGVKYYNDQVKIQIEGKIYKILSLEMSKVTFWLIVMGETCDDDKFIEGKIEDFEKTIEKVIALPPEPKPPQPKYRSPNSIDPTAALILYIVVMVGGLIFKDWWIIWIVATVIYFKSR